MYKIVNKCYNALQSLIKEHIDIPENRNIYVPSYKDSYALVYNNGSWEYNDLKNILECIKNKNLDRISTYYENNIKNYPEKEKNILIK